MTAVDREVPFFNYPHVFMQREQELVDIVRDVGARGAYILQRDLEQFERNLADFVGAGYALGVANGTDALIIALRAAGIEDGDEVIFSSHTYIATAASIHFAGAVPVPVECRSDHMIDPAAVEEAITTRTRAIMPTQLNGRTCDMDALGRIAEEHQLLIVEDAAQGVGSRFKGRGAGTFGIAGTYSFYPAKTLGSLGDGGAVVTNDAGMFERMSLLRDHGRDGGGEVVAWGLNSRLDNLQAAILDHKLGYYGEEIARRREIAASYRAGLAGLDEVVLPPGPDDDSEHFDVYQNYELEAESRDELKQFLRERGIGTLIQWGGKPVHQFSKLGFTSSLPFTDAIFRRCLMLPMNTALSDADVDHIILAIREFYGR